MTTPNSQYYQHNKYTHVHENYCECLQEIDLPEVYKGLLHCSPKGDKKLPPIKIRWEQLGMTDWTINVSWLGHKLLTNIFRGISILVKMARNRRHQIVSVPMSHTYVPVGKVTVKSSLVKRRPWNLPSDLSKNAKNNFNFLCVCRKNWVTLMGERMKCSNKQYNNPSLR